MKRIAFFIASIFCFTACNNDAEIHTDKPESGAQIQLVMPDVEKVSVYSSASESENKIDKIWVIEFNKTTKLAENSELIDGTNIARNGQAAQLLPQLSFTPQIGNIVVCIANSARTAAVPVGYNYNNINNPNALIGFPPKVGPILMRYYYQVGDYLPMYGEMEWRSDNYTCTMTRAVAKFQVKMGESVSDVTGGFTAENTTCYCENIPIGGYIKPEINNILGAGGTNYFKMIQAEGATDVETTFYIHDFPNSTQPTAGGSAIADNVFHKGRFALFLKNKPTAIDSSFYRLDLFDPIAKKFLDIERNHHYTFTINKVRSNGYKTFAEARDQPGSNIEYTIRVEDNSKSMTSNGQYAIVTNVDTTYVDAGVTNASIATVRYQLPSEMTVLSSTLLQNSSISVTSGTGLTVVGLTDFLGFTANQNKDLVVNTTAAFTGGVITFKLGNITHRLIVKKN